ncbi:hypothetical protein STANM309S_03126 [Streptomyces tanashiensis]
MTQNLGGMNQDPAQQLALLLESPGLIDGTPKPVLEKVAKEAAEKAAESLKGAGASVTVK